MNQHKTVDYDAEIRELAERHDWTIKRGRNGTVIAQRGLLRLFASSAQQMCHELRQHTKPLTTYERND